MPDSIEKLVFLSSLFHQLDDNPTIHINSSTNIIDDAIVITIKFYFLFKSFFRLKFKNNVNAIIYKKIIINNNKKKNIN